MANVAGVRQLMETVAPATQAIASSAAPEQSFATAMRQANSDAGVPVTPIEQTVPADTREGRSDSGKIAGKDGEQTSAQASGQPLAQSAQPSASGLSKAAPGAVKPASSLRYTPANMLSAMLGGDKATAALDQENAAQRASSLPVVPVQTTGTPSPVIPPVSLPDVALPVQAASSDIKPADAMALVVSSSAAPGAPAKTTAKAESSSAHASDRSAAKQDAASSVAEALATPVLPVTALPTPQQATLAAPALTTPTPDTNVASMASAVLATMAPSRETRGTLAIQSEKAMVASVVAKPNPNVPTQVASPSINNDERPGASSFGQSLAAQFGTTGAALESSITAFLPVEHPLPTHTGKQPLTPLTQPNLPTTTQASAAAPGPSLPAPGADTTAVAIQPLASPAKAQVPAPLPQNPTHKASGRPALSADAFQPPSSAVQISSAIQPAAVQPAASATSADSKPASHPAVPAISTPAPATGNDASTVAITNLGSAHTPVAITALTNPSVPNFVSQAASTVTSSSISSTSDPLQHTTLTSTPTTLEVGVTSGTHGWLKIRAELNASGTVDASLTGANAAATGRLHNDLPALSSFLQEERVAVGSLNISAPNASAFALHNVVASTLEPASSFTRSAAAEVGATGAAVAGDAGASGGRPPQQQAPDSSAPSTLLREDDAVAASVTSLSPLHYGGVNEFTGGDELSRSGYTGGGSWLNVRV